MPRRGENIYKRKDGRWEGRYIRGRTPAGKAEYTMFAFYAVLMFLPGILETKEAIRWRSYGLNT